MTEQLKPCPFCGGSALANNGPSYLWYVQCQECRIDGAIRPTKFEAIEAWNRRAQPTAESKISTQHGPWLPSREIEGESYCQRCLLRDKFLGQRGCIPHTETLKETNMTLWEVTWVEGNMLRKRQFYANVYDIINTASNNGVNVYAIVSIVQVAQ